MHITTKSKYASKVQKAGMIHALRHNSLNGSLALKYNWNRNRIIIITNYPIRIVLSVLYIKCEPLVLVGLWNYKITLHALTITTKSYALTGTWTRDLKHEKHNYYHLTNITICAYFVLKIYAKCQKLLGVILHTHRVFGEKNP